jgi:hypothetical protein
VDAARRGAYQPPKLAPYKKPSASPWSIDQPNGPQIFQERHHTLESRRFVFVYKTDHSDLSFSCLGIKSLDSAYLSFNQRIHPRWTPSPPRRVTLASAHLPTNMVIKRKRSESELSFSSAFSSPPRPGSSPFDFGAMGASDWAVLSSRPSTPSHLHSRTMKRFRDNRPSEAEVHRELSAHHSVQRQSLTSIQSVPSTFSSPPDNTKPRHARAWLKSTRPWPHPPSRRLNHVAKRSNAPYTASGGCRCQLPALRLTSFCRPPSSAKTLR